MKTGVHIIRGPFRGRAGWISGNLEDREARGVTKAIVHAGADIELLETANLAADRQLALALPDGQTKTPPAGSQRRAIHR